MSDRILELGSKRALICTMEGPLLSDERDAVDFMSLASSADTDLLVVPVSRIDKQFFELRSGLAGPIVQKFAVYQMHLVVLGDVSEWIQQSRAFKDFVYEANNGNSLWFVSDEEDLREKVKSRFGTS